MYQPTVLDDGLDNSQKGKTPVTRPVVCCLRERNAVFNMGLVMDIIKNMYMKMLQKIRNLYRPSVP